MCLTQPILRRTLLFFLFLSGFAIAHAQRAQSEYLEAKRLFREEQYASAQGAFAALSDDPTFGPYATFYTGLSAYRLNDREAAISLWKLILTNNSSWEQLPDVYFWLAKTHFEQENYAQALRYTSEYRARFSNSMDDLRERYIPQANRKQLMDLSEEFPDDRLVITELAKKLDRSSPEDAAYLKELISTYQLEVSDYSEVSTTNVRKSSYSVAVMLPFMFDGLDDPSRTVANKVIMDFYQGMLLAKKDLDSLGMPVTLYPYDTKRDSLTTERLLTNSSMKETDLIVGPFLPGPIEVVKTFSSAHQINMVNPVSSNQSVITGSDFAYLLKAGYHTIGKALATRTQSRFPENKRALVYFSSNDRDSIVALTYKEAVEAAGYEVLDFRSLDNTTSRPILDSLVEQHEEFIATKSEVDSLMQLSGRFIKSRKVDPESKKEMEYLIISREEETEGDSLVYYEMKFNVVEDSIGHIMVSSRNNGIVNNFISAIDSRPDSIGLLGYGNWFNFKVIDYLQFERLDVEVAFPEYINVDSQAYKELYKRTVNAYAGMPSDFVFFGYENMIYLGTMLHKYGKYFQDGLPQEGYFDGTFMSGYKFGINNDNQVVPIISFKDNRLTPVTNADGSYE